MYFIWQFLNLEKLIVSKDVGFHETNLYYSKNLEVATQGENCLDLFPLPTIKIMSKEVQPNSFQVPASDDLPSSERQDADGSTNSVTCEKSDTSQTLIPKVME